MKAILEFNLPEEQESYELAVNGSKYKWMLDDIDQYRRQLYKYEQRTSIPTEEVVEKLIELLQDRD